MTVKASDSPRASRHAFLVPYLTDIFWLLAVSGSVFSEDGWRAIHVAGTVTRFEVIYGVDLQRVEYNKRCMERASAEQRSVIGTHAGFSDIFVPVVARGKTLGLLVSGPIATEHPSSARVFEHWRWLTGRQANPSDPEFVEYLAELVSTLVLPDAELRKFARYLECTAEIMAGTGDAEVTMAEARALRPDLERARHVERMWSMVSSMIDEQTTRSWPSPQRLVPMWALGLSRAPEHVLAVLLPSLHEAPEPVEELLRREAVQRACTEFALKKGNVACGKVGEQGMVFLAALGGVTPRARRRLLDLGEEVRKLARRFGFGVHLGVAPMQDGETLSQTFRRALAAAEGALSRGARSADAATHLEQRGSPLGDLRRELGREIELSPAGVAATFERYLEAAALRSGHRLDLTRAYAEAGFERITEALRERGALEERSYRDMFGRIEEETRRARTIRELFEPYRRAVADLIEALERPVAKSQDRSLKRALAHIQRHYTERIRLDTIAKIAGFSPNYFSQLFRRREDISFAHYVRRLRVERAKHLLAATALPVQRIGELSGFACHPHFTSAFKAATGETPIDFRRRSIPGELSSRSRPPRLGGKHPARKGQLPAQKQRPRGR